MRYAIVIEKAGSNFSAYVLNLPGCMATSDTVAEIETEIRDAIRFHIDGLKEENLDIPPPSSVANYVDASASTIQPHSPENALFARNLG